MPAAQTPADVAIIGAGPVGLTLACALAQSGVAVCILDKSTGTKREPRAAIIWQRAQEDWALLGIMPRILAEANKLCAIEVRHAGQSLGSITLGNVSSEFPHPLILEQHITERLLTDRLRELGVEVEWNAELTGLRLELDQAILQIDQYGNRAEFAAQWVVGCDGSHSLVRDLAGIAFPGRPRHNLQCLTIDAIPNWRYPEGDRSTARFFLAPNIAIGCFPLPGYDGHACRFYAFTTDDHPEQGDCPPTLEEMRDLIARVAGAPELSLTLTEPRWLGRARFQDRIAESLRRGRALIAGDSAHVWAPIAGQGMNTGIVGACNLAWKLAAVVKGQAREELLDTYTDEQRATARLILRETRLDFVENIHSAPVLKALTTVMPIALRQPALQRWIDTTLSSLTVTHHGRSPLAQRFGLTARLTPPSGQTLTLRSGDRFPFHALGASTLPAYQRWLLLYVCSIDSSDDHIGLQLANLRTLAWQYTACIATAALRCATTPHRERIILIRPDSRVGIIARSNDRQALHRYLDQYLLHSSNTPVQV